MRPLRANGAIVDDILRAAAEGDELGRLFAAACERLRAEGVPIARASLGMRTIDPTVRALAFVWRPGEVVASEAVAHGVADEGEAMYRRSPIAYLEPRGLTGHRWRLEAGEGCEDIPLLAELRAAGATDYVMRLVRVGGAVTAVPGAAFAIATDRANGFADAEIEAFDRLLPALGVAAQCSALARVAAELLGVYLGPATARRVLAGEIRRGRGQTITAAILFADLRGFTTLSEAADPLRVVGWLDEHLEAIGGPVADEGGEVLKFLGDGLLAVFPGDAPGPGGEARACARALRAAEAALARTESVNARRRAAGEPALPLDLVLHFGEVVYGNVGAARRLDFTVIGRAVNEASRMEGLCERLGRHLLLSAPFAARCGRATTSLGRHELRGIARLVEVRALERKAVRA